MELETRIYLGFVIVIIALATIMVSILKKDNS